MRELYQTKTNQSIQFFMLGPLLLMYGFLLVISAILGFDIWFVPGNNAELAVLFCVIFIALALSLLLARTLRTIWSKYPTIILMPEGLYLTGTATLGRCFILWEEIETVHRPFWSFGSGLMITPKNKQFWRDKGHPTFPWDLFWPAAQQWVPGKRGFMPVSSGQIDMSIRELERLILRRMEASKSSVTDGLSPRSLDALYEPIPLRQAHKSLALGVLFAVLLGYGSAISLPIWHEGGTIIRELRQQANAGSLVHQNLFATHLRDGQSGAPRSEEMAVYWYKKAANQGFVEAQYNLGLAYLRGRGITQNVNAALVWLNRAALNGSLEAHYQIAAYHLAQKASKETDAQALDHLKAADLPENKRLADVRYLQAFALEEGRGVSRDAMKAWREYKKAAALGSEKATKAVQRLRPFVEPVLTGDRSIRPRKKPDVSR